MENRFFYCYSPVLYRFLRESGVKYICTGLNESTMRQFWQFERNDKLNDLLTEYAGNKPA
ncbi:hypothetical protein A361_10800 [Cytobacillus oceanisediminis 2691]|uniref:DUF5659 domain-containing protein n=1 Tax=Cytobacillus oceanisediminis 2691 TaxID=1196031 RepID=A0A160MAS8_9BACI|nr:hypothetical protein A361_10800 [Cytobacillus oceanisediminis 2691]